MNSKRVKGPRLHLPRTANHSHNHARKAFRSRKRAADSYPGGQQEYLLATHHHGSHEYGITDIEAQFRMALNHWLHLNGGIVVYTSPKLAREPTEAVITPHSGF